jgi:hypothetical protein
MMATAVRTQEDDEVEALAQLLPVSEQIRNFLAGHTNGEALFHALYDDVLDEPIPERLLAVLQG